MKELMQIIFLVCVVAMLRTPSAAQDASGDSRPTVQTNASQSFDKAVFERTFTHRTAKVNNIKLHYVIGGTGEPLVLLHGFSMTWYHWRKIMPALSARYTVIAPDLRGLGDSEKPAAGYDARSVAEDIHQLVQQLGYKRINLVGHDIGGFVAYAYTANYPSEIRRLALVETFIPGSEAEPRGEDEAWHFRFHRVLDLPETLIAGKEREYLSYFFANSYDPASAAPADAVAEYVRTYSAPGGMRAALAHYRAIPEDRQTNQASLRTKLNIPVLALGGERSIGERVLRSARNAFSNVEGEVIERCGHYPAEERPDYFTQLLLAFFGKE